MTKENKLKKLWNYFNTYEKLWMGSMLVLSIVMSILMPEDSANGVSGWIITALYFLDVVVACICELLTSKQSKWSFIIYVFVEFIEIAILIILRARFASMAVSLFMWLPLHIISFVDWHRHPDRDDKSLTEVRKLNWWQQLIMYSSFVVWTIGIGYLGATFSPETDFYNSTLTEQIVAYLDAGVSAVGIACGILLFFRYREAWTIWYVSIALETAINIISGQWLLLVLKLGYLSNTTYGFFVWTKYIKKNKNEALYNDKPPTMIQSIGELQGDSHVEETTKEE